MFLRKGLIPCFTLFITSSFFSPLFSQCECNIAWDCVDRALDAGKTNEYGKAIQCINQAISLNDTVAVYYAIRASFYVEQDYNIKALSDCNRALQINPSLANAHYWAARAYQNLMQDSEQALQFRCESIINSKNHFDRAIQLGPTSSTYYYEYSKYYKYLYELFSDSLNPLNCDGLISEIMCTTETNDCSSSENEACVCKAISLALRAIEIDPDVYPRVCDYYGHLAKLYGIIKDMHKSLKYIKLYNACPH